MLLCFLLLWRLQIAPSFPLFHLPHPLFHLLLKFLSSQQFSINNSSFQHPLDLNSPLLTTMSTVVCQNNMSQNPTTSGWGCIESLSNTYDCHKPEVYVHPLVKRSTSMLSDKSLEMCTESLGSETGTDITEEDIFSLTVSTDSAVADREPRRRYNPMQRMEARKALYESLPPPLTILRGFNSIRVDPIREEGRLVMNVVSTSPRKSSVVAQRSNGRLTLCLSEEADVARDEETSHVVDSGECEEERKISDEEDEDEDGDEMKSLIEEGKDGINVEIGGKFGIMEIQRLRRCKESECGSRRLNNWKTYWVA